MQLGTKFFGQKYTVSKFQEEPMLSFDFMFTLTLDVVGPVYILVSFNARAIYGVLGVFEHPLYHNVTITE